jgi:hypothetical protein
LSKLRNFEVGGAVERPQTPLGTPLDWIFFIHGYPLIQVLEVELSILRFVKVLRKSQTEVLPRFCLRQLSLY